MSPPGRLKEVLALPWSPAWAVPRIWGRDTRSRSSWLLLPRGCGRSGHVLTEARPPVRRQVVWIWKAGRYSKRPPPQTGQQWPFCPQSLPESGSQDFVLPSRARLWGPGGAVPKWLLYQAVPWMLLGLYALAFLPPPLPTYSTWEIFLLYLFRLLVIYCRLASAWFGDEGWGWESIQAVGGLPDLPRSESASSPPVCGTFLVFQPVLAGRALSSVLQLSVRDTTGWVSSPDCKTPAWHRDPASHQPGSASSQNWSAGGSVPTLSPSQPEAWATAWGPAACSGHLMHSLLPVPHLPSWGHTT